MQTVPRGRGSIIDRVEMPYQRSKLFEWLLAHHDEMVAASAGRRVEWRRLCAEFAKARADGRRGQSGECTHSAYDVVARSEGKSPYRCASRRRTRGAREARGGKSAPRYAVAIPQGRVRAAARDDVRDEAEAAGDDRASRRSSGLQLSTAEGVVITKVTRVFKLAGGRPGLRLQGRRVDSSESTNLASALAVRQQHEHFQRSSPMNDKTERDVRKTGTEE